jgi:hypothetical protein
MGLIERHQLLHCGPKMPRSESAFSPGACCGIDHLPSHLILTQIKFIVSGDFFRVMVMVSEVAPQALVAAPQALAIAAAPLHAMATAVAGDRDWGRYGRYAYGDDGDAYPDSGCYYTYSCGTRVVVCDED